MPDVTELITKFGFKGSTDPLESYNESLGDSITLLAGVAVAASASIAVFTQWSSSVLQSIDPMNQLSRATGVAIERIQELGYIASVSGSDLNAVTSTVNGLTQAIGQAAQRGSEDFARLGISVRRQNGDIKTADEILEEVRINFSRLGLSMAEQLTFASALGIDPSLIQLLNRTNSEMSDLTKRARDIGVLTKEQADAASSYNDSLTTMRFSIGAISNLIAVGFAPALENLSLWITDLVSENKDWIVSGIQSTIKWVGLLVDAVERMLPILAATVAVFAAAKIATVGVGTALAAVFSPVVLVTSALVALFLIIDDLLVGFSGGKSVIRDFFLEFTGIDLTDITLAVTDFIELVANLPDNVSSTFSNLKESFLDIFPDIDDIIMFWDSFLNLALMSLDNVRKSAINLLPDWVIDLIGSNLSGTANGAGLSAGLATSSISNISNENRNLNQTNNINISTSDPLVAGQAVDSVLQRQLITANDQLGRGGL